MYASIVVGTDGSETASEAVRHAIKLAGLSGGELHIVGAVKVPADSFAGGEMGALMGSFAGPEFEAEARTEAEGILKRAEAAAAADGVKAEIHFVLGEPAEALMTTASDVGADLIVVGNRGMRGVGRVLGSVPNKISHQSPCHLLIVRTT
jgi:nucleotide-binding universal stress UspA family protein